RLSPIHLSCLYFFFNHTAPPEISTLSLHDALPILPEVRRAEVEQGHPRRQGEGRVVLLPQPRGGASAAHPEEAVLGRRRRHLARSEEHTSELQSLTNLVCRLLLEKKKNIKHTTHST